MSTSKTTRSALKDRLRHAFAVDPPGRAEPTAEEQVAVDWLCEQIARRRLTTPGLICLEMFRPLNYVGAQLMHWVSPAAWAILPHAGHQNYKRLTAFLERRGSMEYLACRVEEIEAEFERREASSDPAPDAEAPPPNPHSDEEIDDEDRP